MKTKMTTVLAAAAVMTMFAGAAQADDVKLDMNQVVGVLTGLGKLDYYSKSETVDGKPVEVKIAYQLGGSVRLALARDAAVLNGAFNEFKAARQAVQLETKGSDDQNSPAGRKLNAETARMAMIKQSYTLETVKTSDLKLDTNPIPVDVLSTLMPILAK